MTTFLDIDADRYFGLPAGCQEAFDCLTKVGAVPEPDVAALAPVINAQLLVPTDVGGDFPMPVAVPVVMESVIDQVEIGPSFWKFFRAWQCQKAAERELRRKPLSTVLANLANRGGSTQHSLTTPADKVLASFFETSIVTKNHDQCLRRSIAMVHYLTQYGCYPLFVIGVRNNPFEAHAWVQIRNIALNDDVEKIGRFTPILAI